MRELTDKFKLSFRSVGEVVELVSSMVLRLRTRGLIYGPDDRALSREVFGNAVFIWLSGQPVDIQERVVREGLAVLGGLVEGVASPSSVSPRPADGAALPISPVRDETRADVLREKAREGGSPALSSKVEPDGDHVKRKVKGKPRAV